MYFGQISKMVVADKQSQFEREARNARSVRMCRGQRRTAPVMRNGAVDYFAALEQLESDELSAAA